jgi:hypothetical protein
VWLPTHVDLGLDTEVAAESAMTLGVIPFVREHRPDAGHDREGSQEKALENERVVDVGRGRHTRDRHPVSIHRDIVLRAPLGAVRRVGARQITPAFGADRAAVQDQIRMAPQHADQHGMDLRQQARLGPACQPSPQGRSADLSLCRGQAAPRCALAQEPPQGR